jgi:hypothetical protein
VLWDSLGCRLQLEQRKVDRRPMELVQVGWACPRPRRRLTEGGRGNEWSLFKGLLLVD